MDTFHQQESSAPLSGGLAAALVLLLGLFAVTQGPLQSARPVSAPSSWDVARGDEVVPARLWQDPFAPSHEHAAGVADDANDWLIKLLGSGTQQNPQQDALERLRDGFSVSARASPPITVLLSMVFGGSYNEIEEGRTRARYAMLTALANRSLVPDDSEHVGYIWFPDDIFGPNEAAARGRLIIPYEWLSHSGHGQNPLEGGRTPVLLMWLNDDVFNTRPLHKLDTLIGHIKQIACDARKESGGKHDTNSGTERKPGHESCDPGDEPRFRIVGPAGSTTLGAMIKDAICHLKHPGKSCSGDASGGLENLRDVPVYSSAATASGEDWFYVEGEADCLDVRQVLDLPVMKGVSGSALRIGDAACGSESRPRSGVEHQHENIDWLFRTALASRFVSTILPDRVLMDDVVQELELRGVDLRNSPIALVSEWDTHYARELPGSFVAALEEHLRPAGSRAEGPSDGQRANAPPRRDPDNVFRFSYMRGIDGHLPGAGDSNMESNNDTEANGQKKNDFAPSRAKRRRPEGHSQYDYLIRLAERLEYEGSRIARQGFRLQPGGFAAIGVLGSDVYDKLLIMQALETRFPNAVFFTTDIDAGFWHPAELPHTRNLVIASTFGLELAEDYYGEAMGRPPPFRDVYQVSRYLATYLSTAQGNDGIATVLPTRIRPRLFEVGRSGPVDISREQAYECEAKDSPGGLAGMASTSGNRSAVPIGVHPCSDDHPPFRRLDLGMARNLALAMLAVLTVVFLATYWRTYTHTIEIDPRSGYVGMIFAALLFLVGFMLVLVGTGVLPNHEPLAWFEGISVWPSYFVRVTAGALAIWFLYTGWKRIKRCDEKLIGLLGYVPKVGDDDGIHPNAERSVSAYSDFLPALAKRYNAYAAFRERRKRVLTLTVVYFLVGICIMLTLGLPHVPFRGPKAFDPIITTGLAVIPMLLLLFAVLDSTKLAAWLARALTGQEADWPAGAIDLYQATKGACGEEDRAETDRSESASVVEDRRLSIGLRDWLSLRVIAEHSEVYGNLVHYPAVVILLMMFSRFSYFDDLPFSPSLVLVVSIAWAYLLFCAVSLRRSAELARTRALTRLESRLAVAKGPSKEESAPVGQLEYAIENIGALKRGGFRPLTQQPWLRSLTYVFGGGGSLILLEYLVWAG